MNAIKTFENPEFGSIRTIEINGDVWFVGKDVAEILGYANASKAVSVHVDEEDKQFIMQDIADSQNGNVPMGRTKTAIINESGLYSLILSSKLPTAKKFKHWVTSEVLPAIRKTGSYSVPKDSYLIENPAERARRWAEEYEEKQQLALTVEKLKPKADYTDTVLKSKGLLTITQISKDYGMSGQKLNSLLHAFGVQYKQSGQWLLYSKYHDKGYAQSETIEFKRSDGSPDTKLETKWTQKGRLFIYARLKANGILPVIERSDKE